MLFLNLAGLQSLRGLGQFSGGCGGYMNEVMKSVLKVAP